MADKLLAVACPATEMRPPEGSRFGRRALAYVVDSAVLIAANYGIGQLAGVILGMGLAVVGTFVGFTPGVSPKNLVFLNFVIGLIISISYFAILEACYGATPGKLLLKMRVLDLGGRPPSLPKALIRAGWRYIDGLFFGLVAASVMAPPLRQRYGDKRAKTMVVSTASPAITDKPSFYRFVLGSVGFCLVSGVLQVVGALPLITIASVP